MNKQILNNILIIIIILAIIIGLISFNFKSEEKPIEKTTTKKVEDNNNVKSETILINGNDVILKLKTFTAFNIFKIDYEVSLFEIVTMSDNSYIIRNLNDLDTFIKIEKYEEEDYIEKIEEEENDSLIIKYKYLNGRNINLKITEQISKNETMEEIKTIMDYMIDTIYIN